MNTPFEALFDTLSLLGTLTEAEKTLLQEIGKIEHYANKELLITEGKTARKMFFLVSGGVRYFHYYEGIEKNIWFSFESTFITSFYSFITQQPSKESVAALEDCTVISFAKDRLFELIEQSPKINRAYINVLEKTVIEKELFMQRNYYTASEKYYNLLEEYPHIIQRVPLGIIASYLGVNQSTLSRIRKKEV